MLTRIDRNSIICDDIKKANGEKYLTSSDFGFDESSNIPEILANTINAQALAETAAIEATQSAAEAAESALEAETTVETFKANATEIVNNAAAETLQNIATTAENYIEEANIIKNDTINAQALAETAALEAIDAKQRVIEIKEELEEKFPDGVTGDGSNSGGSVDFNGVFEEYVTFNGGLISNSDIVLNGSRLLLANGASVELYTEDGLPLPPNGDSNNSSIKSYVIETWVEENNWYRVYSDGWIEQGGIGTTGTAINFFVPFTKVPNILVSGKNDGGNNQQAIGHHNLTSTGFTPMRYSGGTLEIFWRAYGY